MRVKTLETETKAGEVTGENKGEFEAYAAVFGNKDLHGDVIVKGAFAETIKQWNASGKALPVYWSHRVDDPEYCIGSALALEEDEHGLKISGRLDLDNPKGAQAYRLMKDGRVNNLSFMFDVVDWEEKDEFTELKELKLYEVSVCVYGANPETEVLSVKDTNLLNRLKEGRVLSTKNVDALEKAIDLIKSVIDNAEKTAGEDAKSAPVKTDNAAAAQLIRSIEINSII